MPTQKLYTFAIHTSHLATKNCKRACLFATVFLPTLKTVFPGNSSTPIERILNWGNLIID